MFEAKDIKRDLIPAFNALNQILANKIARQSKESEEYCSAILYSKEHPSSTEASEDVQKIYCIKCGAALEYSYKYCFKCGFEIEKIKHKMEQQNT